jgi:acylphosphatase
MKHVSIRVFGKVQGVFFRASTRDRARGLNISGNVRNEPDGSVSIEAEGSEEAIAEFVAWCRRGPLLARVDRCDVNENPVQNLTGFSIL